MDLRKLRIRGDQQDKVMMQLMRTWLYEYDHSAMLCPKVEPMIKRLVGMVRGLLDEFCTTYTPDDLLVVVFYYADKFIERVGFVDKNHLTGVLISSVIVTVKFHEDKGLYNSWVAVSCNLTRKDTHHMERVFLSTLKYELMITSSQVHKFFSVHNKAWEERSAMYSSPQSKPSRSTSTSSNKHKLAPSRTVSAPAQITSKPTSSSKRPPLQPISTKSKIPSSSSSSLLPSKSTTKLPTTQSAKQINNAISSSKPATSKSQPPQQPLKPTSNKLSKVSKAYKMLGMFKICV